VHGVTQRPVVLAYPSLAHFRWGVWREQLRLWLLTQPWPAGLLDKLLHDLLVLPDDWCIERPGSYFGVPVPDRAGHFYVWFEALLGYGTLIEQAGGHVHDPVTHIVGKDILTFHALRWPAVAWALGQPSPRIQVHGHLLDSKRQKLSKSAGNAPDLDLLLSQWGLDTVRVDWLSRSPGTPDDLPISTAALAVTRRSWASWVGNTYRRLLPLVTDLSPSSPVVDQEWQKLLTHLDASAHRALALGDWQGWLNQLALGLRTLNQALSNERWWESRGSPRVHEGWSFLTHLLRHAQVAWPSVLDSWSLLDQQSRHAECVAETVFLDPAPTTSPSKKA
jgi:methionyl-tRNA synthetase